MGHTHGSGGGGLGTAVLVIVGAALAVKLAGPVLVAASELLQMVLIAAAVIVGVSAAGLVGLLTWRWHRRHTDAARATLPNPGAVSPLHGVARAAQRLPESRPAIEAPRPEVHLHLHGISAEDVAEIIARHGRQE
jgi:hypothetical protein